MWMRIPNFRRHDWNLSGVSRFDATHEKLTDSLTLTSFDIAQVGHITPF